MGLIRVSDDAERRIKELAGRRTVTATVDSLVSGGAGDLKDYLDAKFSAVEKRLMKIEKMIDNNSLY